MSIGVRADRPGKMGSAGAAQDQAGRNGYVAHRQLGMLQALEHGSHGDHADAGAILMDGC
jgi:hypothetical protein